MSADQKRQLDEQFMTRALALAAQGRGSVEPNPMVGALLVKAGRIIAEGFHRRFGQPHAEREALSACSESPAGATLYVNLEPCCHIEKKTPPCVPALIEAKLSRVVVGCLDPNPAVAGRGIEQLEAAGIDVELGVKYLESKQLNAPFFARTILGHPYVTLKWAQSADRKVAGGGGARKQISNPTSMRLVHELRAKSDAVLVGIGTVLADDPLLTARGVPNPRPLIRAVMDSNLRTPITSRLVTTAAESKVIIYCLAETLDSSRAAALRERGVEVVPLITGRMSKPAPSLMLKDLAQRGVTHLLVDAGPTLAQNLIDYGLVDRVWIFHSPMLINDPTAPSAASTPFREIASVDVGGDRLVELLNPFSEVFFAPTPSPDFLSANHLLKSPS
jgi:diaminohydroxyphosphoribosylaminopyrimidine deaminase/5-amino-6-(5-phosphoribosylamino)uracil reductase